VAFPYSRPCLSNEGLDACCGAVRTDIIHTHTPVRVYLSVQEERKVTAAEDCVAGVTDLGCGARPRPSPPPRATTRPYLASFRENVLSTRAVQRSSGNRIFAPSAAAE